MFSNPEEELIVSESELCIDYDVSEETDNDTGGENWDLGFNNKFVVTFGQSFHLFWCLNKLLKYWN